MSNRRRWRNIAVGIAAVGALVAGGWNIQTVAASTASAASKTVGTTETSNGYRFKPANITVKAGTKVTWKNTSDAPHTVTSKTKSWKYDKKFNKNTLSVTFKKAGTFKYFCKYHPGMVGSVKVTM